MIHQLAGKCGADNGKKQRSKIGNDQLEIPALQQGERVAGEQFTLRRQRSGGEKTGDHEKNLNGNPGILAEP